ncbi:MAG: hypothetical protein ACOCXG_04785 [Nanoarchaeota archaeon]
MTCLIALISSGKGTWKQVLTLLNSAKWDKVFLICNEFSYDNFDINPSKALKLKIDTKKLEKSVKTLGDFLKKEVNDLEIAVNLSSGDGMEHMAIVSSVLRAGLGIRFVYPDTVGDVKEFEIFDQKFSEEQEDDYF